MKTANFENIAEFWPFYLSEHKNLLNRKLHFVGTTLNNLIILTAILRMQPSLLLMAPVFAYGFAWSGHFLVEKNRPATFKYPLWSLICDYRMYGMMLTGKLWGPATA